jgi:hypothetical protein
MAITWQPYFLTLMCIGTIPGGFVFLITWRITRRFGGRGLAVVALVAAVLGPVRDYRYMATFPEWGAYAPGLAPVFAISVAYVILGILGHGTMRLVAGPALFSMNYFLPAAGPATLTSGGASNISKFLAKRPRSSAAILS